MRLLLRAGRLDARRAGLRDSCDISLALLFGQLRELRDVLVPFAGAGPAALVADIEVGLNEHGGCGGRGGVWRECYADHADGHQDYAGNSPGAGALPEGSIPAAVEQQRAGD